MSVKSQKVFSKQPEILHVFPEADDIKFYSSIVFHVKEPLFAILPNLKSIHKKYMIHAAAMRKIILVKNMFECFSRCLISQKSFKKFCRKCRGSENAWAWALGRLDSHNVCPKEDI